MRKLTVNIIAGCLEVNLTQETMPLETLLTFASRENPKRGYLFVSKVLGKHIPSPPSHMRAVQNALAEKISLNDPQILVVGMAETAIALAGGVAHSLLQQNPDVDVIYTQTTRHTLTQPIAFTIDENHSHAPNHIVYQMPASLNEVAKQTRHAIIVDDEISTGRTLQVLSKKLKEHYPQLEKITWVSIANWLTDTQQQAHRAMLVGLDIEFISLLAGHFSFQQHAQFNPKLPTNIDGGITKIQARKDTGRMGLRINQQSYRMMPPPEKSEPMVIVGQGEFVLQPYLWAEALEKEGMDVLFQSTTRSPIISGDAIQRKIEFSNTNTPSTTQFCYNLPNDRQIIYSYETAEHAARCGLRKKHPGQAVILC